VLTVGAVVLESTGLPAPNFNSNLGRFRKPSCCRGEVGFRRIRVIAVRTGERPLTGPKAAALKALALAAPVRRERRLTGTEHDFG
jgi:hypothetical protein